MLINVGYGTEGFYKNGQIQSPHHSGLHLPRHRLTNVQLDRYKNFDKFQPSQHSWPDQIGMVKINQRMQVYRMQVYRIPVADEMITSKHVLL